MPPKTRTSTAITIRPTVAFSDNSVELMESLASMTPSVVLTRSLLSEICYTYLENDCPTLMIVDMNLTEIDPSTVFAVVATALPMPLPDTLRCIFIHMNKMAFIQHGEVKSAVAPQSYPMLRMSGQQSAAYTHEIIVELGQFLAKTPGQPRVDNGSTLALGANVEPPQYTSECDNPVCSSNRDGLAKIETIIAELTLGTPRGTSTSASASEKRPSDRTECTYCRRSYVNSYIHTHMHICKSRPADT